MPKGYKSEVIQRIELVLARYGANANLGSYAARETIAKEIWNAVLQIINKPDAGDVLMYNPNNEFEEAKDRQVRKVKNLGNDIEYKFVSPHDPGDENNNTEEE